MSVNWNSHIYFLLMTFFSFVKIMLIMSYTFVAFYCVFKLFRAEA